MSPAVTPPDRSFSSAIASAIFAAAALAALPDASASGPAPERRAELVRLVRQDCGSCHGMTLAGGLGPALLPDTLAGKPADSLVATIVGGRPGTAMPGWSRFVTEDEAKWIVDALGRGFPELAKEHR